MVGNDVVDLADPEADPATLHPRFDGRVFARSERRWLSARTDSARARWSLWAGKEAAYKLARKIAPGTIFSPVRFVVTFESAPWQACPADDRWPARAESRGLVRHGEAVFALRVSHASDWVHAVATQQGVSPEQPLTGLARLDSRSAGPSQAVRELACGEIARHLGVAVTKLEVRKRERVPQLFLAGRPAALDLSFSHHGSFIAFACSVDGRASIPAGGGAS